MEVQGIQGDPGLRREGWRRFHLLLIPIVRRIWGLKRKLVGDPDELRTLGQRGRCRWRRGDLHPSHSAVRRYFRRLKQVLACPRLERALAGLACGAPLRSRVCGTFRYTCGERRNSPVICFFRKKSSVQGLATMRRVR